MTDIRKKALITGATSGFGKVIAKHLVRNNYEVIVLARSEAKMNALKKDLQAITPDCAVHYISCDLSSLASVVSACEQFNIQFVKADLLILNAGIWNPKFQTSADGIEETLQVNLLAPLLTIYKLKEFAAIADRAKIIITGSGLHQGTIQFDDLEFKTGFSGLKVYRQSKLGVILINRLLATMPEFANYTFYSVHPGMIKTELGRNAGWFSRLIFKLLGKSLAEGAKTHIRIIDASPETLTNGEYYANCEVTKTTDEANDMEMASKLLAALREYLREYLPK